MVWLAGYYRLRSRVYFPRIQTDVSLLFPLIHPRKVIHITCNIGARDSPDMYALSPQALGIHIRQIPRAHVTTITVHIVQVFL